MPEEAPHAAPSAKPVSAYLDQSVLGQVLDSTGGSWSDSALAQVSKDAGVEFWVSPSNIVETYQCTGRQRRQALALLALEAISARRMIHSFEFEEVSGFLSILQKASEAAINWDLFEARKSCRTDLYLGALALEAAYSRDRDDALVDNLVRVKTESQLIHLRFAKAPNEWLANMEASVAGEPIPFPDLDVGTKGASIDKMREEISKDCTSLKPPSKDVLTKLQKRRRPLACSYGAYEVPMALAACLPHPIEQMWVVRVPEITEGWGNLVAECGFGNLPPEFAEATPATLLDPAKFAPFIWHVCKEMARHCAPMAGYLRYATLLWELQKAFSNGSLPTAGLTFDLNHIVAVMNCEVFISCDSSLTSTAKTLAKELRNRPEVVGEADQLAKAVKRIQARREA